MNMPITPLNLLIGSSAIIMFMFAIGMTGMAIFNDDGWGEKCAYLVVAGMLTLICGRIFGWW